MRFSDYAQLSFERDGPLLVGTIENPPINLVTPAMVGDFVRLTAELEAADDIRVFLLRS